MSRLLLAVVLVMGMARSAGADENPCPDPGCHLKSGGTLTTRKGSVLELPPGYFLDEPTFVRRHVELVDAQDKVTRLGAENRVLREEASRPGWKITLVVGVVNTIVGAYLWHRLSD